MIAHPLMLTPQGAGTAPAGAPADLAAELRGPIRRLGVEHAESWRRRDILRGRLHPAYHLDHLIRGAHRAGRPIEEPLRLAGAVEVFVYDLWGSTDPLVLHWMDAFRLEQQVNLETDLAQFDALERRHCRFTGGSALERAEQAFARQRVVSGICERACRLARIGGLAS